MIKMLQSGDIIVDPAGGLRIPKYDHPEVLRFYKEAVKFVRSTRGKHRVQRLTNFVHNAFEYDVLWLGIGI